MLDAILFLLTGCSVGSSKPKEKLEPPPGGRSTLRREAALHPVPAPNCTPSTKTEAPAHHFNYPGKLLPEFHPGTISPLLFSGTYKNKMLPCSTCALVPSGVTPRAALTSLSQKKIKNNYVGMSNSSFFKSTLGRLIFIFKLAAQQRLKFESKDWLHH